MPRLIESSQLAEFGLNREWSFGDCMRALYRRKSTVLLFTAAAILCTALISAIQPRVYRARVLLEAQLPNENFLDLRDVYAAAPATDAVTYMQTQADTVLQDGVLTEVARKLGLDQMPEYQGSGGVLERLRRTIDVEPLRNSRVLQITCDARHPQLAADLANSLAAAFIEQGIAARQRAARETYESLQPAIGAFRRGIRTYEGTDERTGERSADTEANRRVYENLKQKADEAWVASTASQSNFRWINAAEVPRQPHTPNLPLNLGMGALAGLLLGVAWVMLGEQNTSVLRDPSEAGSFLTLPELGVIPRARRKTPEPAVQNPARAVSEGDDALERMLDLSESFRATAASILSLQRNGHSRMFVITSPLATEGKTTVVSHLGIALAEIGSKVLLIDGDLRRPRLHAVFDQANSWGLSDVLREQNAIDELPLDALTRKTAIPRLSLLPSGACAENIFGLLHSGRMSSLLPRFREAFDYVLVDAPPCLEFADARIIAQHVDQLVLVVRANYTEPRIARAAVERLRLDGVAIVGFILNRFEPNRGVYRYSNFHGWNGRSDS
jgi:polysaccharide biosynthesis transport protein